jgi:acyl carrier protein
MEERVIIFRLNNTHKMNPSRYHEQFQRFRYYLDEWKELNKSNIKFLVVDEQAEILPFSEHYQPLQEIVNMTAEEAAKMLKEENEKEKSFVENVKEIASKPIFKSAQADEIERSYDDVYAKICHIIKSIVDVNETVEYYYIGLNTRFKEDLNFDSLDAIELTMEIEEEFGIHITDDEAESVRTVEQCIKLTKEKIAEENEDGR